MKDESLQPINIDEESWMYAEKGALTFVHECRRNGEFVKTDIVSVPWRLVERALKLRPKPKKGKRR